MISAKITSYSTRDDSCIPNRAVAAGHGVEVAVHVLDDADVPHAFDWTVPAGYFTDRGQEIPPGIEEIDEEERLAREQRSLDVMRDYFADRHPGSPRPHPELADAPEDGASPTQD